MIGASTNAGNTPRPRPAACQAAASQTLRGDHLAVPEETEQDVMREITRSA